MINSCVELVVVSGPWVLVALTARASFAVVISSVHCSVIASATAQNVLQNLTIPQGGLFRPVSTPGADYLIETNPAFTNQKTFISSDYYLQQIGLNPQTTEKRLGDGFYEQMLVRNQITSLTGKAVLGPYSDAQAMYQALLAAGASLAQSLSLPFGMSLSAEQVAALTSNVVIMQTEIVDGQSVLVPVVYRQHAQGSEAGLGERFEWRDAGNRSGWQRASECDDAQAIFPDASSTSSHTVWSISRVFTAVRSVADLVAIPCPTAERSISMRSIFDN